MSTLYVNTITPNSGDTVNVSGSLFVSGTINLGDANTDSVSFGAEISSSIIPDANDTYDLGSSAKSWKVIHGTSSLAQTASFVLNAVSSSHVGANGAAASQTNITSVGTLTSLGVAGNITMGDGTSSLIVSGNMSSSGTSTHNILIATTSTSSNAIVTGDLNVGDDLTLSSDNAIFNMGAGNDFRIIHSGSGVEIHGSPIEVQSTGSLALSSSVDVAIHGADDVLITSMDDIQITTPDLLKLSTTSNDGDILISSQHGAGVALHIDANADETGSIVDIDAGILDIDVGGATTIDSNGIALGAGSGELDLTTSGILDINAGNVTLDASDNITVTAGTTGSIKFQSSESSSLSIATVINSSSGSAIVTNLVGASPGLGYIKPVAEVVGNSDQAVALTKELSGYTIVVSSTGTTTFTLPAIPTQLDTGVHYRIVQNGTLAGGKSTIVKTNGAGSDNNDNIFTEIIHVGGGSGDEITSDIDGDTVTLPATNTAGSYIDIECIIGGTSEVWLAKAYGINAIPTTTDS